MGDHHAQAFSLPEVQQPQWYDNQPMMQQQISPPMPPMLPGLCHQAGMMLDCTGVQVPTSPTSFSSANFSPTYGAGLPPSSPWDYAGQSPMGCSMMQVSMMGDSMTQQSPMGCAMMPSSFGQAAMTESIMPSSAPIARHLWTSEDVNAVLTCGSSVDRKMLEQHLRAAGPTCYDD